MSSSRFRSALLLALFAAAGCEWDIGQALFHPAADARVQESFELPTPAAVAVAPDSFRFAMFGDIHIRHDTVSMLGRFRQDVGPKGIDFFCVVGDLAHDGMTDEYARAESVLDAVGIPYYVTAGNHDLYQADGWQSFKTTFGPATYAVVIADRLKLIFLDTADGTVGAQQFDWLEQELGDSTHTKLVGTHFPMYDGAGPIMRRIASTAERQKLESRLRDGGAYGYVAGHIHGWRHALVEGVNHFTVGSMPPTAAELDYGRRGYLLFTFAHDSLSWERIDF